MTSLAEFQQQFLTAYQAGDMMTLQSFLSSQTPPLRLNIYRDSVTGGLIKCLRETYDVCNRLVGDEFFDALAQRYIAETPSTSPDLGNYGESFADFVESFEHTQALPYLADMCRLAWAYHLAKRHPGDIDFDVRVLQSGSLNKDTPLPSSAQVITSPYPLLAIWRLCMEGGDETIKLKEGEYYCFMVWRQGVVVRIDGLPPPSPLRGTQ